jgi:type I restriction enzyme S subunit
MKTQKPKAAEAQSEELEFGPSGLGAVTLNAPDPTPDPKQRKPIAQGGAPGCVAQDPASPVNLKERELPGGWNLKTIGEIATKVGSGLTPRRGKESYLASGVPLIRSQNVLMNRLDLSDVAFISHETHDSMARSKLVPDDVLLNITGASIGRVAVVPDSLRQANVNQHVCLIRLRPGTDPHFACLYLSTKQGQAQILGSQYGTTRQGLNFGQVRQLRLLHPPLPEQRAIAEVLRTVQGAKEACERVLAAARQLKQSLLHHLFICGTVPLAHAAHVPLKETEIGPMPETWRVARIGELGEVITGTTPSTKRPDFYGGPFMFIAPGDIGSGKYIALAEKHLTATGLAECRSLPRASVVVVCIGATIGKVGLTVENSGATNQQCNSVIPNAGVLAEFLFYAMSLRAQALPLLAGRAAIPIVNKSNFCDFRVPVAPLPEQREIAAQLSAVDAKLAAEESRRAALAALFQSLLHHLMTGQVRLPEFTGGQEVNLASPEALPQDNAQPKHA